MARRNAAILDVEGMKKVFTITVIVALAAGLYGQPLTFWQKNKKAFAITGVQLASLTLEAVGNGLMDAHRYDGQPVSYIKWGHTLKAAGYGVAFLTIPMINWEQPVAEGLKLAVSWGFMRYGMFDLMYNETRGLGALYAGTTSTHDNILSKMPEHGRAFTKGLAITVSVAINFKEFGYGRTAQTGNTD